MLVVPSVSVEGPDYNASVITQREKLKPINRLRLLHMDRKNLFKLINYKYLLLNMEKSIKKQKSQKHLRIEIRSNIR